MRLNYTVIDPTGNITLLVTTPVPRALHAQTAAWLMRREPTAEQVGFLEPSDSAPARLQMMGGEFCANATMALAAWLAQRSHAPYGQPLPLQLEISGAQGLIPCDVTSVRYGCLCTVALPLPERLETLTLPTNRDPISLTAVFLPGICHLIAPAGALAKAEAESLLRRWSTGIDAEAVGLILLDEDTVTIDPLVYVKPTDTAVWERCCGSGSAATACYLTAKRSASQTLSIRQRGGTIAAVTHWDGQALRHLHITGSVQLRGEKTVDVVF